MMNVLTEENYVERISSLTVEDWKPLLDLIPIIENVETFRTKTEPEKNEKDVIMLGGWREGPVVSQFLEAVYDIPIIIDFNWGSWDEGRSIASNPGFDYDTVDIPTKCKLITAFVRNDRFCEGALASNFEDGTILRILKSISRQFNSGSKHEE